MISENLSREIFGKVEKISLRKFARNGIMEASSYRSLPFGIIRSLSFDVFLAYFSSFVYVVQFHFSLVSSGIPGFDNVNSFIICNRSLR